MPSNAIRGIVVAAIGAINLVESEGKLYECKVQGKLISYYKNSSIVAVGDEVYFLPSDEKFDLQNELEKGTIIKIGERFTRLSRVSPQNKNNEHVIASNIDNLLIFSSAADPFYNKRLIDRYLVAAIAGGLTPIIAINKSELFDNEILREDIEIYENIGVDLFLISVIEKKGLNELYKRLENSKTVITGQSGVGKSTFVNEILGNKQQVVGKISDSTAKGQHTTSFVRMFEAANNTHIIDTPGIREFALFGISKHELPTYFIDFLEFHNSCKFTPCSHIHEPKCAVKNAVENGQINFERYESYLLLSESIDNDKKQ